MSALREDFRGLIETSQALLDAVRSGDLDAAERLAAERGETLERLDARRGEPRSEDMEALLGRARELDQSLGRVAESGLEELRAELGEVRRQRQAVATLRARGRGEPRFVSHRA